MPVVIVNHVGDGPHNMGYVIAGAIADTGTYDPEQWPHGWWAGMDEGWYRAGRTMWGSGVVAKSLERERGASDYYDAWLALVTVSLLRNQVLYDRLGSLQCLEAVCGESAYGGLCPSGHFDYVKWSERTGFPYRGKFPQAGDKWVLASLAGRNYVPGYIEIGQSGGPAGYEIQTEHGLENVGPDRMEGYPYDPADPWGRNLSR